jgi:histidine phosphotransfer protein HptB
MSNSCIDHLTFNELKQTVGDEFIAELVTTFFEEAPPMLAELRRAFDAKDADSFRRTAHSLKTNANTFGVRALGEQAKSLEHGGIPVDTAPLDQLDLTYQETANALRALLNG